MTAARRDAWVGLALCVAFCAVGVAARGLRWDETLEHAQVLAGAVAYPEGHPLPHYLARAFSLQTLLSTGMLWIGLGEAALCAARNFLFLCATVLPVYALLLALRLGALGACAGALLVAQGVLLEFDGNYPLQVWPELYSNGHIGTGWVVLTVAALAAPWPRTAMLLLGLLSGVHAGQAPLAIVIAIAAMCAPLPEARALRAAWRWLALGVGLVAMGWLAHRLLAGAPPALAASVKNSDALWRAYTFGHDPHRQIPRAAAWLTVFAAAGLAALAWRAERSWRVGVVAAYALAVGAVMAGTGAAHGLLGASTPAWLLQWMPYRLVNHVAPLLLALALAGLWRAAPSQRPAVWLVAGLVAWGAITPYLGAFVPDRIYTRYVAPGEAVAFVIVGAGWAHWAIAGAPGRGAAGLLMGALPAAALGFHRFGAACLMLGHALAWVGRHATRGVAAARGPMPVGPGPRGGAHLAIAALCALAAAQTLANQARARATLPRSDFEAAVARWAAEEAPRAPALLTPPEGHGAQARLGAAVLADAATLSLISYVPAVGGAVAAMLLDVYGMDLLGGDAGPGWRAHWASLDAAGWRALAARHGITHVAAPADLALPLPVVLETPTGRVHALK